MTTTKERQFVFRPLPDAVSTRAASDTPAARDFQNPDYGGETWDSVEGKLIDWGCNRSQLDEEGMETPAAATITRAIELAYQLSRAGNPAPTRVTADPRGRIAFEFQGHDYFESLHLDAAGVIDHRLFEGNRLIGRETIQL